MLGTVPDGVMALHMTASRVIQEVEVDKVRDYPEEFCTRDMTASPKVVMVQIRVTTQSNITHDGVKTGSRQSDFIMCGELTASEFPS